MKVSENLQNSYNTNVNNVSKVKHNEGFESDITQEDTFINAKLIGTDYDYKHEVLWPNVIVFLILHLLGIWGYILMVTGIGWKTTVWSLFIGYCGAEGVTIGAHRCFTHKSFKPTPILRALIILLQTVAGQNSMYTWCRDHRMHHRYSDTDADPHNIKRGFFFSHMGWLMVKKHPLVKELGKKIDMSDLQADWMVQFQKKYYLPLYIVFAIFIPAAVPVIFFGKSWWESILVAYFARYLLSLHGAWLVNSAAHMYGTRPYDKNIHPVESWIVSVITLGEGWHNYHHAFPWDYKAAEIGMPFNASASIIELFEKLGLAYDLKSAPVEMVKNRIIRTGDVSHYDDAEDIDLDSLHSWFSTKCVTPGAK